MEEHIFEARDHPVAHMRKFEARATLAERILLAHPEADDLVPGDIVMVRCDVVMTNDISGPIAFRTMEKMGATRVFDREKVVVVPDHFIPAKDTRSAELQKLLREWSAAQGDSPPRRRRGRGGGRRTSIPNGRHASFHAGDVRCRRTRAWMALQGGRE